MGIVGCTYLIAATSSDKQHCHTHTHKTTLPHNKISVAPVDKGFCFVNSNRDQMLIPKKRVGWRNTAIIISVLMSFVIHRLDWFECVESIEWNLHQAQQSYILQWQKRNGITARIPVSPWTTIINGQETHSHEQQQISSTTQIGYLIVHEYNSTNISSICQLHPSWHAWRDHCRRLFRWATWLIFLRIKTFRRLDNCCCSNLMDHSVRHFSNDYFTVSLFFASLFSCFSLFIMIARIWF